MSNEVTVFANCQNILGEGPVWSVSQQSLYWVDIKASSLYRQSLDGKQHRLSFDKRPSALGLCDDGQLIIAFEDGIFFVDPQTGQRQLHVQLEANLANNRSNDGKVGPDGCFWVGTMDDKEQEASGSLYVIGSKQTSQKLLQDISISNTLAWDKHRKRFYFADSKEQVIWSFEYTENHPMIRKKQIFVSLKGSTFYPDGSTIDAQGNLWNAQWDGSRVVCYDPQGNILQIITLPISRPTSCCFGGPDLRTLFITTASVGLSAQQLQQEPLAGSVLQVRLPVSGNPAFIYQT